MQVHTPATPTHFTMALSIQDRELLNDLCNTTNDVLVENPWLQYDDKKTYHATTRMLFGVVNILNHMKLREEARQGSEVHLSMTNEVLRNVDKELLTTSLEREGYDAHFVYNTNYRGNDEGWASVDTKLTIKNKPRGVEPGGDEDDEEGAVGLE